MRAAEGLVAACVLVGCAGGPAPLGLDSAAPRAELGTGSTEFEPVGVGQVLPVTRGSQGGVHVSGAVRTWGVGGGSIDDVQAWTNNDRPIIGFELRSAEGVMSIGEPVRRALVPAEGGALELLDVVVQFNYWVDLPEDWGGIDWAAEEARLEGLDLELYVSVEDQDGVFVQDQQAVRIAFPPRPGDDDDDGGGGSEGE